MAFDSSPITHVYSPLNNVVFTLLILPAFVLFNGCLDMEKRQEWQKERKKRERENTIQTEARIKGWGKKGN